MRLLRALPAGRLDAQNSALIVARALSIGLILISGFTLKPLYPLVLSFGYLAIMIGFYLYAAQDSRLELTGDFVAATLGPSVHGFLFWVAYVVGPFCWGGIVALFTSRFRRTLLEAVRLEKATFHLQRYFSPAVAEKITGAEEGFLKPGGHRQDVAVMFADIRDFTSLSERLSPEEVVRFLSEYHSEMVQIIFELGVTLDKFIGDGIMAVFGSPDPAPDDCERAVGAARRMQRSVEQLNRGWMERGIGQISQGIGIHYGSVIVGNVGSEDRLEYTVIGDTVNAASRIEGACKTLGGSILISNQVSDQLHDQTGLEDHGFIELKGKSEKIQVFGVPT